MDRLTELSCIAKSVSSTDKSHAGLDRSINLVLFEECKGRTLRTLNVLRPSQLRLPLARGNSVVKAIEIESTRSWLRRARPERTSIAPAEHDLAARQIDAGSVDGWDPWDVWLHYIDQPRRRRAGWRSWQLERPGT
jgi:hypothetical protein